MSPLSNTVKFFIGLGVVFLLGFYVLGAKFSAETYEASITAQDETMQNTWGMSEQELSMGGFTVQNYGETFIKTLQANAERYKNDQGAMMKWVQESSSQMSPELHLKFMDSITKVYAKREAKQNSKISVAQEYRTWLNASIKGSIAKYVLSYPSDKALKIMDRIISTSNTKKTWETGVEAPAANPFKS